VDAAVNLAELILVQELDTVLKKYLIPFTVVICPLVGDTGNVIFYSLIVL